MHVRVVFVIMSEKANKEINQAYRKQYFVIHSFHLVEIMN